MTFPDDDKSLEIYNRDLIALSSRADRPKILPLPDASARAVSPICGSEVEIFLKLNGDVIEDVGFAVEACALTKAAVAVIAAAAPGKTRKDVSRAGEEMEKMLEGGGEGPSGDFEGLRILLPVRDYKARHNAILLPFEAIEKAFKNKT